MLRNINLTFTHRLVRRLPGRLNRAQRERRITSARPLSRLFSEKKKPGQYAVMHVLPSLVRQWSVRNARRPHKMLFVIVLLNGSGRLPAVSIEPLR